MNISNFFSHWGIGENPFTAEEARHDPVYQRIMKDEMTHPDFEKIYGSPTAAGTSVVFGEKGSGKTAIRLLIEQRIADFNEANPEQKAWVVNYDDLNPIIDRIGRSAQHLGLAKNDLSHIRLADHMDAILSQVTTDLVNLIMGDDADLTEARKLRRKLRNMSRQKRVDLAELVMIYDQPNTSNLMHRWHKVLSFLRVGNLLNRTVMLWTWLVCLLAGAGGIAAIELDKGGWPVYLLTGLFGTGFLLSFYHWAAQTLSGRRLARKFHKEVRAVERDKSQLRGRIGGMYLRDLKSQPLPLPGDLDSRYELSHRLMKIVEELNFANLIVLVDRVDEPAQVNGDPAKMKSIVWPMLHNKFLQQDHIGFKLLLPIELSHLLKKEGEEFYQQARMDKQNMVERLEWTGSTLYDICTRRVAGCKSENSKFTKLTDLFEESVTTQDLMDALDQMTQPRDAFKFMYQTIQDHCSNTPDDSPIYKIPKLTLDNVRKHQSQRVKDLYRGIAPA